MRAPVPSQEESRRTVEIPGPADLRSVRCVRGRPLTYYWPWFQQQVRSVMLPPHERVTDRSVIWNWSESGGRNPLSPAELAQLRSDLRKIESGFRAITESGAANEVIDEVRCAISSIAAALAARSDRHLAAYAARTTSGVMIHSWSSLIPPDPKSIRVKDANFEGVVQRGGNRDEAEESMRRSHAGDADHAGQGFLGADRTAQHGVLRERHSTRKWLCGAGGGVVLAVLMIAGFRWTEGGHSLEFHEGRVSRDTRDNRETGGAPIQSEPASTSRAERGKGTEKRNGARTAISVQKIFGGDLEPGTIENTGRAASVLSSRAKESAKPGALSSANGWEENFSERPPVFPSREDSSLLAGGALHSDGVGLPIDSRMPGGSPSSNLAGKGPDSSPIDPAGGSGALTRSASSETENSTGKLHLRTGGDGESLLPANAPPADTFQTLPKARPIPEEEDLGKKGGAHETDSDQWVAPAADRERVRGAEGITRLDALQQARPERERTLSASKEAMLTATRTLRLGMSPWTFILVRDAVVSTRPVPVGLKDDSALKRQALLEERQAAAPRALVETVFTWGMAIDLPADSSGSGWRLSGDIEDRFVRHEGRRLLISLPVGSPTEEVQRFQWEGQDGRRMFVSLFSDGADGIRVVLSDGLRAAIWISAEPGNFDHRPAGSNGDARGARAEWTTSPSMEPSCANIAGVGGAHPRLELPLDALLNANGPVTITLRDEESGWGWTSRLRIR